MRLPVIAAGLLAAVIAVPAIAFDAEQRAAIRDEVRAFLLENPAILREMIAALEEEEQVAQAGADRDIVALHADALFEDGFSHVSGNPDGGITIVEFIDYQCGFCRRAFPEVQALVEQDGDIRLVTKEFPILGPNSEAASRAAIVTLIDEGPEAYERLGAALMTLEGQVTEPALDAALRAAGLDPAAIRAGMDDPEVTRRIAQTRGLAQAMGIQGTPTFVVEDRLIRGFVPLPQMQGIVAEARADQG